MAKTFKIVLSLSSLLVGRHIAGQPASDSTEHIFVMFFFTNVNRKSRKLHFETEKSKILEFSKHLCMGENIAITDLQGHICVIVYLSCVIVHFCIYVFVYG